MKHYQAIGLELLFSFFMAYIASTLTTPLAAWFVLVSIFSALGSLIHTVASVGDGLILNDIKIKKD